MCVRSRERERGGEGLAKREREREWWTEGEREWERGDGGRKRENTLKGIERRIGGIKIQKNMW